MARLTADLACQAIAELSTGSVCPVQRTGVCTVAANRNARAEGTPGGLHSECVRVRARTVAHTPAGQAPGRCSHTRSGAVYSIMSSATNQRCPTNVNDVVTPFAGTRRGRHEWHKRPAMRIEESDDGRCRRGLRFFSPTRRQCRRDRSGLPRAVLSSSCGDLLLSGVVGFSRRRVGKDGALMSQSTLFMSRPPRQES